MENMENTIQTRTPAPIIIGGLVPFTTIDYPSKLSAVIFLQGCPWRCIYCSNPHLFEFRKPTDSDTENWYYVRDLINKRKKIIDAVVFSGGEATAQSDGIIQAIQEIKEFAPHLKFGLHTNGCFPEKLSTLLPYIDWIGLDIKAPREKYAQITRVSNSADTAYQSLELVRNSGKDFEVRTTADPTVLTKEDIIAIATELSKIGIKHYAIQRYRPVKKDDPKNPPATAITQFFTDNEFVEKIKNLIPNTEMRF